MNKIALQIREGIKRELTSIHPSDAIAILESLGKEMRRANSIRISNNMPVHLIEMERPDLQTIKP